MKAVSVNGFNQLSSQEALELLEKCCGSSNWCTQMEACRPFESVAQIKNRASRLWNSLSKEDWKEAFSHHPKIGDLESLQKKFTGTRSWAEEEQKGSSQAPLEVLKELSLQNEVYEKRFGFIFIVCATGKTAYEMLNLLKERLKNKLDEEMVIAAREQEKITQIRLEKCIYE